MKVDEIRGLSEKEVRARIGELEEERFRLQFRSATEPLEDPLRLRSLRKDIARLHTVLNEKPGSKSGQRKAKRTGTAEKAKGVERAAK
jgi:large subunit ribosomal protein L29